MTDETDLTDLSDTTTSLSETLGDLSGLSRSFGQSLTGALKAAVVQGKSLDVVLRGIAERLSSRMLDMALSPLTSAITGAFGGLLGFADGGVFSAGRLRAFADGGVVGGGRVRPFAAGGVVATPSYFPMAGGSLGLMGEAGAEAIMPLARGPDGRLGVAASGGAVTHVSVNITTPDAASFRRSEAQVTGMMARAVGRGRRGL